MEYLSLMKHLELNGTLRVHGACDKGTHHLKKEWLIKQRNETSDKEQIKWQRNVYSRRGMEHLGREWNILWCSMMKMRHLKVDAPSLKIDAPLHDQDVPHMFLDEPFMLWCSSKMFIDDAHGRCSWGWRIQKLLHDRLWLVDSIRGPMGLNH